MSPSLVTTDQINQWIEQIPYAKMIGVQALETENGLIFELAVKKTNIGNPVLPALHGGVVAAFMETAAILNVMALTDGQKIPKIINFSLDYLRSVELKPTYARCELGRMGKRVVNVAVHVWQDQQDEKPLALGRAHLIWPQENHNEA
ncbi:PaaI family thioesterase [Marinospirillum sp. MEB164]|uniref:PaaI family thioesterase n=1 Tax=Marinospirillum alkalitolerans TaxID=3123374 RepID=A0ABW8PZ88_9GAMM